MNVMEVSTCTHAMDSAMLAVLWDAPGPFDLWEELESLKCPVLLVLRHGKKATCIETANQKVILTFTVRSK
jgi:hypothetical protein